MNDILSGTPAKTAREVENSPKPKIASMSSRANNRIKGRLAFQQQGFGPLWSKTYRVRLKGAQVGATEVIQRWKENFSKFWPNGNYFYEPLTGIKAGEVALVQSEIGNGLKLSTGMVVVESNDHSFSLVTAKGHVFAGRVKFSAYDTPDGPVAQVHLLARSADPLVEVAMLVIGHDLEDEFWEATLTSLARYFGVKSRVQARVICADDNIKWNHITNVRYNPLIRAVF